MEPKLDLPETLKVAQYETYGEKRYALEDRDSRYVGFIEAIGRGLDDDRAIARRLAAAWNAVRGIPTESLEAVAAQPTDLARANALARVPFPTEAV